MNDIRCNFSHRLSTTSAPFITILQATTSPPRPRIARFPHFDHSHDRAGLLTTPGDSLPTATWRPPDGLRADPYCVWAGRRSRNPGTCGARAIVMCVRVAQHSRSPPSPLGLGGVSACFCSQWISSPLLFSWSPLQLSAVSLARSHPASASSRESPAWRFVSLGLVLALYRRPPAKLVSAGGRSLEVFGRWF